MGKAGAAMAMVATAPCQAEVYGPGAREVAAVRRAVWVAVMWR